KDEGLLSVEERAFVFWLAVGHLRRHTPLEVQPADAPLCPDRGGDCRNAGAAEAILLGCDALRDRKEIPPGQELRVAFKKAPPHLQALIAAVDDYLENCGILHRDRWDKIPAAAHAPKSPVTIHDHRAVCELPDLLGDRVHEVVRLMRHVDKVS